MDQNDEYQDPSFTRVVCAMAAVLSSPVPDYLHALLLHGSPLKDEQLDRQLLEQAAKMHAKGRVGKLVLNGLPAGTCAEKNLPYPGFEPWRDILYSLGKTDEDLVIMTAAGHTGAESKNMVALAQQEGWDRIGVSSQEYHTFRCFLSILPPIFDSSHFLWVYAVPAPPAEWDRELVRTVMSGQTVTGLTDAVGTLDKHVGGEFRRIIDYARIPTEEKKFTRHGTMDQVFEYLAGRDAV